MATASEELFAVPAEIVIPDDRAQLGRGYKVIDHEFTSNSALARPERSDEKPSGEWAFKISVAETKQALIDSLDLKVSADGKVWGAKVSGSTSWAHKTEIHRDTLLVVLSARRETRIDRIDIGTARLRDEATGLMNDGKFSEFYDKYGSHFVSSTVHGAEAHIVFRRDFESLSEKKKAAAELGAKRTDWSAKADAAKKTTETIDAYRLTAEGHGVGSMVEMKDFGAMKAGDVVNWLLNDWTSGAREGEPAQLRVRVSDLWTVEGADAAYQRALAPPCATFERLTEVMRRVQSLGARCRYLHEDKEACKPTQAQRDDLKTCGRAASGWTAALDSHFGETPKFELKEPGDLIAMEDVVRSEREIQAIERALQVRRPISGLDEFRLRENEYRKYIGGPKEDCPLMVDSWREAATLQFIGEAPRIGAHLLIHSKVGVGDRHLIAARGRNEWIGYSRSMKGDPDDRFAWTILGKRRRTGDEDDRIRHGDYLRIGGKHRQSVGIKSRQSGARWWAKGCWQDSHFLVIERIEEESVAIESVTEPASADS